ncbi:glyoxalase superfamily protein [Cohnella sp. GCM10012308]|uniref:glyoxalase superfamily protein n=1 Tax=Cohnella sp. GCM10012308 TaxID=3317329 RepID=UPI0036201AD2
MTQLERIIPILRIFDEAKAKTFYIDFLGFSLDWEHRFEPDMPLYMQVSKDGIQIHLSEHHGDCSPGAAIRVHTSGVRELQKELIGKKYAYARPGLEKTPWNSEECTVTDPFGNRLVFCEYLT